MPEGPEVYIVSQAIKHIEGQKIVSLRMQCPSYTHRAYLPERHELPLTVRKVEYVGKRIAVHITTVQNKHIILMVFLAMSGTIRYEATKHMRGYITFGTTYKCGNNRTVAPSWTLYFNEVRPFGFFYIVEPNELLQYTRTLGPCYVTNFNASSMLAHLVGRGVTKSGKCVAQVLLDNEFFNGVGNYIRSDALYLASVHPQKRCYDLTEERWGFLIISVRRVIEQAIQTGGMSMRDYKHPSGELGKYETLIYGRNVTATGLPVKRIDIDKRGVYYADNQI